jgi:hypothetical protein
MRRAVGATLMQTDVQSISIIWTNLNGYAYISNAKMRPPIRDALMS